ncbi:MAG: hypothetical protein J7J87_00060 [Candidatus Diapherotrites archaeon]|nr:hypothetical protein [Candidatus Diapherotrites archaeon]
MSAQNFLSDSRAQSEWSAVYMLLILAIVAILLISVVKPMYQNSQKIVARTKSSLGG